MKKATRRRIRVHFGDRCAYCRSPLSLFPGADQIDHIVPRSEGGGDEDDNLCLCCVWCNLRKGDRIFVRDPTTFERVRLFHPRKQQWQDHFEWADNGTRLVGLTPCGRATIDALDLNDVDFIHTRQYWVIAGWHPPGVTEA